LTVASTAAPALGAMASVEQEIWNIFTFYTLHGNPLDPEHIRVSSLRHETRVLGYAPLSTGGQQNDARSFSQPLAVCVFHYYFGVQCTQFVKLARDCQLVGSTLSEADPPLLEADIQVAYTAEVKRHDRGAGSLQKMNYNDFLTAMMKIAIKVYPRSRTGASRLPRVSTLRLPAPSPWMRDLSVRASCAVICAAFSAPNPPLPPAPMQSTRRSSAC